jgi:anti-anti-sigma factor
MKLERIDGPEAITFTVKGSLTGLAESAIKLFEQISKDIEQGGKPILIDMKSALFIDSIAIGLVIGVMLKASGMSQSVRMLNVPDHVASVFDTINLKKAFPNAY